jgi:hypothetical protein
MVIVDLVDALFTSSIAVTLEWHYVVSIASATVAERFHYRWKSELWPVCRCSLTYIGLFNWFHSLGA